MWCCCHAAVCSWEMVCNGSTCGEWSYFEGQGPIQVAGNGGDDVTLGHSVVTGVGEALATAAAALALIDLCSARPHCYCTATL